MRNRSFCFGCQSFAPEPETGESERFFLKSLRPRGRTLCLKRLAYPASADSASLSRSTTISVSSGCCDRGLQSTNRTAGNSRAGLPGFALKLSRRVLRQKENTARTKRASLLVLRTGEPLGNCWLDHLQVRDFNDRVVCPATNSQGQIDQVAVGLRTAAAVSDEQSGWLFRVRCVGYRFASQRELHRTRVGM